MKKTIVLTIAKADFTFHVEVQNHSDFVDAAARGSSMTASAYNFVMRTIEPTQKEDLLKLLAASPGAELQIASELKADFSPVLEIAVKK